jgi:hypothetical protein
MQACFQELNVENTPLQQRDETLALARVLNLRCKDVVNQQQAGSPDLNSRREPRSLLQTHWLRRQLMYVSAGKLCSFKQEMKSAASEMQIYVQVPHNVVRSRTH